MVAPGSLIGIRLNYLLHKYTILVVHSLQDNTIQHSLTSININNHSTTTTLPLTQHPPWMHAPIKSTTLMIPNFFFNNSSSMLNHHHNHSICSINNNSSTHISSIKKCRQINPGVHL